MDKPTGPQAKAILAVRLGTGEDGWAHTLPPLHFDRRTMARTFKACVTRGWLESKTTREVLGFEHTTYRLTETGACALSSTVEGKVKQT